MAKGDRPTYHYPFGGPTTTDELWLIESYLLNRCGLLVSRAVVENVRNLMREYTRQVLHELQHAADDARTVPDDMDFQVASLSAALAFDLPAEE